MFSNSAMPVLSDIEVFTRTESLLLNNSTVAFSSGIFWSLRMVMVALPFCWARAIVEMITHTVSKVKSLMRKTIFLKTLKKKADEIAKLYQHCLAEHEWTKKKAIRKNSCQFFT